MYLLKMLNLAVKKCYSYCVIQILFIPLHHRNKTTSLTLILHIYGQQV